MTTYWCYCCKVWWLQVQRIYWATLSYSAASLHFKHCSPVLRSCYTDEGLGLFIMTCKVIFSHYLMLSVTLNTQVSCHFNAPFHSNVFFLLLLPFMKLNAHIHTWFVITSLEPPWSSMQLTQVWCGNLKRPVHQLLEWTLQWSRRYLMSRRFWIFSWERMSN